MKFFNFRKYIFKKNTYKKNDITLIILYILIIMLLVFSVISIVRKKKKTQEIIPEIKKEINIEDKKEEIKKDIVATFDNIKQFDNMEDLQKYVYTIDETAYVEKKDLPIEDFLEYNFKTDLKSSEPKILIFHTHSQEAFINSRKGEIDDTIVGVGRKLANILGNDYGIKVVHDVGKYDFVNGKEVRGGSYEKMEPATKKIIEKYPSIEIAIDIHRDAMNKDVKLVTEIDGKPTAKIMFFNGITKENNDGKPKELPNLHNPYLKDNLAFSLHMFLKANELYPGFTRRNYIKAYRYSLHLLPKSLLIEVGANTNTIEEAKNAMYPLADILVKILE